MLVDYSYTLQIRLSKDNIEDVGAAAQKLGFLDLEDECRKVRRSVSVRVPPMPHCPEDDLKTDPYRLLHSFHWTLFRRTTGSETANI